MSDDDDLDRYYEKQDYAWQGHLQREQGYADRAVDRLRDGLGDTTTISPIEKKPPPAHEQFENAIDELRHFLDTSTSIPKDMIDRWHQILKFPRYPAITLLKLDTLIYQINRIEAEIDELITKSSSYSDASRGLRFDNETSWIKAQLDKLKHIITEVKTGAESNPF